MDVSKTLTSVSTSYLTDPDLKSSYAGSPQNGYCGENVFRTSINIKMENNDSYYSTNHKKSQEQGSYQNKIHDSNNSSRPEYVSLSKISVKQETTEPRSRPTGYGFTQQDQPSFNLLPTYHQSQGYGVNPDSLQNAYSSTCPTQYVSHVQDTFYDRVPTAAAGDRHYTLMGAYQTNHHQSQYNMPASRVAPHSRKVRKAYYLS